MCNLIGLFILSKLREVAPNIGLYRDDGLAVCIGTCKENEETSQEICKIFKDIGLAVTPEANSKVVDFLDISLDLNSELYKPYKKENDMPLYINSRSNHPPTVIKNIMMGVNRMLSTISSNKQVFDNSVKDYQDTLKISGHNQ